MFMFCDFSFSVGRPVARWMTGFVVSLALSAIAGCGGGEPLVSVFNSVADKYIYDEGIVSPSAAQEAELHASGIETWSRRCRVASGRNPVTGKLEWLYVDGVPPVYVIVDIESSDVAEAVAKGWTIYKESEHWTDEEYREFKCEDRGL